MSDLTSEQQIYEAGSAGWLGRPASIIGVLGAGTMGSGIAQLAARSGARTLLHDPFPEALARGIAGAEDGLRKEMVKGKLKEEDAAAASERLEPAEDLAAFADCELVIEAAPERLELKHEIYARLSEIVSEQCVLATNTSSLLVTAIATGASHPERVVGMHFFNPPPLMRLLEVIAGVESSERAVALARATGEAMGKTVIIAKDGPGVHRQPLQPAVRPGGAADAAGADRGLRDDRPHLPHGGRLSHGPVRADGPRRRRHGLRDLQELLRAELRRAALAAFADRRALRRGGPARAQERPRLLRLHAGRRARTAPRTPSRRRTARPAPAKASS